MCALSFLGTLDSYSEEYNGKAVSTAVITYASVRGLSAVISFLQESSMTVGAGVSIDLAVGQILDPVNDLIERFSSVMLIAITSLGIQGVLIIIGQLLLFKVFLLVIGVAALIQLWGLYGNNNLLALTLKIFLILVLSRFSIPVVVLMNNAIYTHTMEDEYIKESKVIDNTAEKIESLNTVSTPDINNTNNNQKKTSEEKSGVFSKLSNWWDNTSIDPSKKISAVQDTANEAISSIFSIIVIFILQTVMLPCLFIFLLYKTAQGIVKLDIVSILNNAQNLKSEQLLLSK